MDVQKAMMDFFLEKELPWQCCMLIFNWKGFIDTRQPCKKIWEALEALEFEKDCNYKDYAWWGDLQLRDVTFNLVQWVSIIEGRFLPQNLFVAWKGEMVDGLVQKFCQK
jgi:hypothetical protein